MLAIGALAFLGAKLEQEQRKNEGFEEERDELRARLDESEEENYGDWRSADET